jgi:hypothetical protein
MWFISFLDSHPEILCRGEGRFFERSFEREDFEQSQPKDHGEILQRIEQRIEQRIDYFRDDLPVLDCETESMHECLAANTPKTSGSSEWRRSCARRHAILLPPAWGRHTRRMRSCRANRTSI